MTDPATKLASELLAVFNGEADHGTINTAVFLINRAFQQHGDEIKEKWHKAGYQDGIEEAAKVADNWGEYLGLEIGEEIRNLKGKPS